MASAVVRRGGALKDADNAEWRGSCMVRGSAFVGVWGGARWHEGAAREAEDIADEHIYYHVVFTTTRGKPVFLNDEIDAEFKRLARQSARNKGWASLELETMPNHVHVLIGKAPWIPLPRLVNDLKGITARHLLQRFDWLRGDLDSYHLWNRSYHYVRHTDASLATVRAYIRNQRHAGGLAD